jgi:hypothetical protein
MTEPLLQVIEAYIKDREQKQPAKPHIPTYELYVLRSESDDTDSDDASESDNDTDDTESDDAIESDDDTEHV